MADASWLDELTTMRTHMGNSLSEIDQFCKAAERAAKGAPEPDEDGDDDEVAPKEDLEAMGDEMRELHDDLEAGVEELDNIIERWTDAYGD